MPVYPREHILEQIIQTISDVSGVEPSELNGQTSLFSDLSLDSLAMFEIVIELEEIFKLQISDDDIDKIKTIDDIVRHIEQKSS